MYTSALTTSRSAVVYKRLDGGSAGAGCRFLNGARHFGLCALPGRARHHDPAHRSLKGTSV
ncbi:unnamed protein product [Staurois parvus]|uniref:Uncharacterized protein n=1 Tax=Staurois parvus TaxID=386267 RepID=A0ABN9E921_9NEOB|nr:unnamed protein product [Staurois parvus]